MIIGLGRYLLTTTSRTREEIPDTSGVDGQPDRSGTSLSRHHADYAPKNLDAQVTSVGTFVVQTGSMFREAKK